MVSNGAQLILKELREKKCDLRKMNEYAVIQINDTHPTMIIPELIRILVDEKAFTIDEAIDVVSKTCAYTNHTILAEALENGRLHIWKRLYRSLYRSSKSLISAFVRNMTMREYRSSIRTTESIWHILISITDSQSMVWQRSIQRF